MNQKINGHTAEYIKRQARNIKKELKITHLEALDKAAIDAGFTGWDNFINKSKESTNRKRVKTKPAAKMPSPLVLAYHPFGSKNGEVRPNAKIPLKAHLELGELLKELANATEEHKRAKNAIGYVRTTLDDWAQREYTSREELSDDVFSQMYYGDHSSSVEYSPSSERKQQLVILCQKAKIILNKHYHECRPRRILTKKLDLAIKWINNWPNNKKRQRSYRSRTIILPGTLVRIKRSNKPAILIKHDSWGVMKCYSDSGPIHIARYEVTVPKEQSSISAFKPMRLWLPYGKWTYADGTELLFNRDYRPLWARRKDGKVIPVDPDAMVENNGGGEFFFDDETTPWGGNKKALTTCISILQAWGVEHHIPGTLKLLPEVIATGGTDVLKYVNREKKFA